MLNLSKSDLLFLSNFASINESIHFYPGNRQSVVSNSGDCFAFANFEEEFPQEFCLYDLNHFISVYSLVSSTGDTVLKFPKEKQYLEIQSDKTSQDIKFCDSKLVEELDRTKKYVIEKPDIQFKLTESMLDYGKKAAAINGFQHIVFEGDAKELYMVAETIPENKQEKHRSERHRRKIDQPNETGRKFSAIFKVDKLKMLSDDYTVKIAAKGGASFDSLNRDYTFFAALREPVQFHDAATSVKVEQEEYETMED